MKNVSSESVIELREAEETDLGPEGKHLDEGTRISYGSVSEQSSLLLDHNQNAHDLPQLWAFHPGRTQQALHLYTSRFSDAALKARINRRALLITIKKEDRWWYVHCCGFEGWLYIDDSFPVKQVYHVRRYEDWRANNWFLFGGRVMLGSDARMFCATNMLIFVPSMLFFWCVLPRLESFYSSSHSTFPYIIRTAMYVLLTYTCANLWLCAFSDPGILPRRQKHLKPIPPPSSAVIASEDTGAIPSRPTIVNPANEWKFCGTCNIYRPPRSKHCKACQNCVLDFDHHCPWTGNCIAKRNYRYFLRFLSSLTLFTATAFVVSNFFRGIFANWGTLVTAAVTFFFIWSLFSLGSYHFYLMGVGQTTNENINNVYRSMDNPFNRGFFNNCLVSCCEERPESMLTNQLEVISAEQFIKENLPDPVVPNV
eukprot:GSChrysophyteH1.ASY1.ANO1.2718.1 assembled CDS